MKIHTSLLVMGITIAAMPAFAGPSSPVVNQPGAAQVAVANKVYFAVTAFNGASLSKDGANYKLVIKQPNITVIPHPMTNFQKIGPKQFVSFWSPNKQGNFSQVAPNSSFMVTNNANNNNRSSDSTVVIKNASTDGNNLVLSLAPLPNQPALQPFNNAGVMMYVDFGGGGGH